MGSVPWDANVTSQSMKVGMVVRMVHKINPESTYSNFGPPQSPGIPSRPSSDLEKAKSAQQT